MSQIHSAYIHGRYAYIVMNQFSVDYRPKLDTYNPLDPYGDREIPGYNGEKLIIKDAKSPRLTELQVCKVVSHLLEALMFMDDRRLTHHDISHRNYLVDEDLNVSDPDLANISVGCVCRESS